MWTDGFGAETTLWPHGFESIEVIKPCLAFAVDFIR